MNDRRFFILAALVAVALTAGVQATPASDHEYFPQSVASGDPRPDSVVLWTRVDSPTDEEPKLLQVEVASDPGFTKTVLTREVPASAGNDYCVKVLVDGLLPYHDYYYRFRYGEEFSRIGRTRTAPDPLSAQPIRFGVVYCQDYIGRYYNAYAKLLLDHDEDIDFVVHLGDYIYETTGDPSFQSPDGERGIDFVDTDGAIPLGSGENEYYAAASLSNYRDIYRTYHSDPMLREVRERWPIVAIWDDHEYSNDSWGANATYSNGRRDEYDEDRRRNAEQAFFEWVPIAAGLGDDGLLDLNAANLYPNSMIYRDFMFGSLLHLVLTDLRTYRPDHLIPEDAFPGTIAVDEMALAGMLGDGWGAIRGSFDPYVDMDLLGAGLPILRQTSALIAANLYMMENSDLDIFEAIDLAEAAISGNVSTTFINGLYEAAGLPAPFTPEIQAMLPRGISFLFMGKSSIYSSSGSRTQILNDPFQLYAGYRYQMTGGAAQEAYGSTQNAWVQGTLLSSPATWKVLGNSFIMTPLVIDFTHPFIASILPPGFPPELKTRLITNGEDFNGLPQKKMEILKVLESVENAVIISGDIHATFVTDHQNGTFEFTPPAISSSTNGEIVLSTIASDPILGQIPGIAVLASNYGLLLQLSATNDQMVSPSDIFYQNTWSHGYAVMDVSAGSFDVTIQEIDSDEIENNYYDDPDALNALFEAVSFSITNGELSFLP